MLQAIGLSLLIYIVDYFSVSLSLSHYLFELFLQLLRSIFLSESLMVLSKEIERDKEQNSWALSTSGNDEFNLIFFQSN